MAEAQNFHDHLRTQFRAMESVVVAYSGGVDSALVLKIATEVLGPQAVGLTADGPALSRREREMAVKLATQMGANHKMVVSKEIEDPNYQSNGANRCYFCKSELYRLTEASRLELGFKHVANGTNTDDLGDHRPGLTAASESGVKSPLVDAKMGKQDVRALAAEVGLEVWDKPASPCLASRIPYGTRVTPERLHQIEQLENALRDLGFRELRVRYHQGAARIEVGSKELDRAFQERGALVAAGKHAGFFHVSLDLEGFRSGSLNRALPLLRE